MSLGLFITLEGPEGSGKSTHAQRLVERLTHEGLPVLAVREPGGTPLGEAIRHLLQHSSDGEVMCAESELLLFLASRAQLVQTVIRPALNRGDHVICDRFADSTFAYQGYGRGFDLEHLIRINELAVQGLAPDLTLLLDVDIAEGFERLRARQLRTQSSGDRIERAGLDFHERVRHGFLELARRWPNRFVIIRTHRTRDAVAQDIFNAVTHMLGTRQKQEKKI